MIVAVGDDQPALRIEHHRVRGPELARARSGPADDPQELAVTVEHRDAPDEIRIFDIRMALGHVDVAVARVGDDGVRIGQRVRRISPHARRPQRHQHLAFGTELDDDASFLVFARKLPELVGVRHPRVRHPHVSVPIDMDAMRPHEHSAAEAPDLPA